MRDDWKVFVEYRPGVMSTFIYVSRARGDNKVEFLTKGGDEAVVVDRTSAFKDEVYFARFEDEVIGRDILMDNGTPVNHTLHNFRDRQRQALKKIKERL